MGDNLSNSTGILARLRDLTIVFAPFVFAGWTYYGFYLKELPTYAYSFEASMKVLPKSSFNTDKDYCHYVVNVWVKNVGKSPFDITGLKIKIWNFVFPKHVDQAQFFEFADLRNKKPLAEMSSGSAKVFLKRYELNDSVNYYFDFLYPQAATGDFVYATLEVESPQPGLASRLFSETHFRNSCE
jgi:hypothetical protein